MILKPFFDLFSLGSKHDTLPFHAPCSLAVLGHHVEVLIEHLDEAGSSGSLETVEVKRGLAALGWIRLFRGVPHRTARAGIF